MAQGQEPLFHWLVARKAWFAAWRFFEKKPRDAILFLVFIAAGGFVYYKLYGLPATKEQIVPVLIFTVGPIVALWVAIFIWHLWLAPFAILYEEFRANSIMQPSDKPLIPAKLAPINWAIWKQRSEYSIYEFAKILSRTDPGSQSMSTEGSSYARLLSEEMKNKKLKYIPEYGYSLDGSRFQKAIGYETYIKRDDALQWAVAKNFSVDHVS